MTIGTRAAGARARTAGVPRALALAGLLAALGALGAPAPGRAAETPSLTPLRARFTDQAIARDRAAMDALEHRLAANDTIGAPRRAYLRELAREWLAAAREQYDRNDRSGFLEECFSRAAAFAAALETGGVEPTFPTGALAGAPTFRDDLWELAGRLELDPGFRCAAAAIARLEVALARAGHESALCRPGEPHPWAAAAEERAAKARSLAESCAPVVEAPAPPPAARPWQTAPRPMPVAPVPQPPLAQIALQRLGALNNVHFDVNADTLGAASAGVLDSVAILLRTVPEIRATLIGHTDPRGSASYNLALGQRRARAVRDYLVRAGVDSARVTFSSMGLWSPVAAGTGIRDLALNRRVEIIYLTPAGVPLEVHSQERDLQLDRERRAQPKPGAGQAKPPAAPPRLSGEP